MDLRALDDRLVPRWARWAQHGRARVRAAVAAAPRPAAVLRDLDDRYASRGALRVVRDVPVLGVLMAATVLVAGAGTGVALAWSGQPPTSPARPALGAPPGADADAHLAGAREEVVELARQAPGTRRLALLSLRDELTIAQTARLVVESTMVIRTVWVRAPVPGSPELLEVPAGQDVTASLTALYAATAQRKAEEQRELGALARGTVPAVEDTREVREAYDRAAATAGREAAAYRAGCACVLAVLVEGTAGELAELFSLPAVRGVEVAARGADVSALEVWPLPPDVSGPVPAGGRAATDRPAGATAGR